MVDQTPDGDAAGGTTTTTRQRLSTRQQASVRSLLDAAEDVLRARGYDDLTLRLVASEAGVTHTTAYTYFSSKAHLVAEVFWRRLRAIPHPEPMTDVPLRARVEAALGAPGRSMRDAPELAQAALAALLSSDPDVERLRDDIGTDLARRLHVAFGGDVDRAIADTLLLTFSGAMLQAGMGYFDFDGVVERVGVAAELLDR